MYVGCNLIDEREQTGLGGLRKWCCRNKRAQGGLGLGRSKPFEVAAKNSLGSGKRWILHTTESDSRSENGLASWRDRLAVFFCCKYSILFPGGFQSLFLRRAPPVKDTFYFVPRQ